MDFEGGSSIPRNIARAGLTAGGLFAASAAVASGAPAAKQPQPKPRTSLSIDDSRIAPGQAVEVSGKAVGSFHRRLTVEYRRSGSGVFKPLATTKVGHGDRYSRKVRPKATGALRASVTPPGAKRPVRSKAVRVRVVRDLQIGGRRLHSRVGGRTLVVKGRGAPRQTVRFQVRRNGHWSTLDRSKARGDGRFRSEVKPRSTLSAPGRIVAGDRKRWVGRVDVYRYAQASWYGPGLYGNHLGCGGTLGTGTLGVANKSLPCGTKVTLRHGSRSVRVKVIDRGPYVAGREYDLTAATARKLGFSGHGAILTTK